MTLEDYRAIYKAYLTDPEAVEPVLVKTNLDGSYAYHSIGFARKDSGIDSLDDMKGKKFGFGDPFDTNNDDDATMVPVDTAIAHEMARLDALDSADRSGGDQCHGHRAHPPEDHLYPEQHQQ